MKKVLALVLAVILCLLMTACEGIKIAAGTTRTAEVTIDNSDEYDDRIEIKEFEYSLDGKKLYFYAHVYNPNDEYALMYPMINLAVRDADGVLLNPNRRIGGFGVSLLPNSDWCGVWAIDVDGIPSTIDIDVPAPEDLRNYMIVAKKEYRNIHFNILSTELKKNEENKRMVGEIENPNSISISQPRLKVVFRNSKGNIVGYGEGLLNDIPAHETVSFSVYLTVVEGRVTDNYEVYVDASGYDVEVYSEAGKDWMSDVLRFH